MKASHLRENILSEKEARKRGFKVSSSINYHDLGTDLYVDVIDRLDEVTEACRGTKNAENSARRENYFILVFSLTDKMETLLLCRYTPTKRVCIIECMMTSTK